MSVYTMSSIMYHITYAIHHTGAYRTGNNSWLEQRIAGSMKETRDTIECKRYTTPS